MTQISNNEFLSKDEFYKIHAAAFNNSNKAMA